MDTQSLKIKNIADITPLHGDTALFRTSGDVCPGFQSPDGSFDCVLHHMHAIDSLDSPLVQHLLIS